MLTRFSFKSFDGRSITLALRHAALGDNGDFSTIKTDEKKNKLGALGKERKGTVRSIVYNTPGIPKTPGFEYLHTEFYRYCDTRYKATKLCL